MKEESIKIFAREQNLYMTKDEIWKIIEDESRQCGVVLFDLEFHPDVLRVYISPMPGAADSAPSDGKVHGVSIDDCAKLSHRITDHERVDEILIGEMLLEVSSPGVNRKLTRPEHFLTAIGERAKVKFTPVDHPTMVVRGVIQAAFDQGFSLLDEDKKDLREIAYTTVKEARIDFQF